MQVLSLALTFIKAGMGTVAALHGTPTAFAHARMQIAEKLQDGLDWLPINNIRNICDDLGVQELSEEMTQDGKVSVTAVRCYYFQRDGNGIPKKVPLRAVGDSKMEAYRTLKEIMLDDKAPEEHVRYFIIPDQEGNGKWIKARSSEYASLHQSPKGHFGYVQRTGKYPFENVRSLSRYIFPSRLRQAEVSFDF